MVVDYPRRRWLSTIRQLQLATVTVTSRWNWRMLLGQRRRWMNGTIAAYCYWLFDQGELEFAMSGLRNARLLQAMWALQLHQV